METVNKGITRYFDKNGEEITEEEFYKKYDLKTKGDRKDSPSSSDRKQKGGA